MDNVSVLSTCKAVGTVDRCRLPGTRVHGGVVPPSGTVT